LLFAGESTPYIPERPLVADEETNVNEDAPLEAVEADDSAEVEAVVVPDDGTVAQVEAGELEAQSEISAGEDEPVADAGDEPGADAGDAPEATITSGGKKKKKRLPRAERRQRPKVKRAPSAERKPIVRLVKPEQARGRRQERQGTVVSDAMEKTIVVEVHMLKAHRKYKKVVRRSTKFHAHDEGNTAKVGDVVRIVETRPLSRQKRWRLVEIVEEAK
jgi:small subunit ribosomal protein S17